VRKEWEYHSVRFFFESTSRKVIVTEIDNARPPGIGYSQKLELHSYLEEVGLDGWEVVGMSGSGDDGFIVIKREIMYG
jgi:hypothetical protein